MNTDQDIERAITGWLHETAVRRAPDRVLDVAGRTIDHTKQRRYAAWRVPMFSSLPKMLAAGVAIVAIALAGGLVGRSTAGIAAPGASSSQASPGTASEESVVAYRAARNAICGDAQPAKDALSPRWQSVYDADTTDEQRADGTAALQEFATLTEQVGDKLDALAAPPELAQAHAANVAQYRDLTSLYRHVVSLLLEGKVEEASIADATTDVISVEFEAFERFNQLTPCP